MSMHIKQRVYLILLLIKHFFYNFFYSEYMLHVIYTYFSESLANVLDRCVRFIRLVTLSFQQQANILSL